MPRIPRASSPTMHVLTGMAGGSAILAAALFGWRYRRWAAHLLCAGTLADLIMQMRQVTIIRLRSLGAEPWSLKELEQTCEYLAATLLPAAFLVTLAIVAVRFYRSPRPTQHSI